MALWLSCSECFRICFPFWFESPQWAESASLHTRPGEALTCGQNPETLKDLGWCLVYMRYLINTCAIQNP